MNPAFFSCPKYEPGSLETSLLHFFPRTGKHFDDPVPVMTQLL